MSSALLRIYLLIACSLVGGILSAASCSKTYSPERLLFVYVHERSIDETVELLTGILKDNGFDIEDAGSEHPLTPESRKMRRLIVAKHPNGTEVVLNNFYTPENLHVTFHRMESNDLNELQKTYELIVEALEVQGVDYRVVSDEERYGRSAAPDD